MPRPPKKRNSPFSSRSPSPGPGDIVQRPDLDRGLVRPEWKERLKQRAQERAQIERPGGRPAPAPSARPGVRPGARPSRKERSKWWDPFAIWAPAPEEAEAPQAEAERRRRFQEAIVPEAEREYVKAQAEAWRRGERAFERGGPQAAYSQRYQGQRQGQPGAAQPAPTPVKPPALEVTPEYVAQIFDPEKMFSHVREMKRDPRFKSHGNVGSVGVISPAGMDEWGRVLKTAQFFGNPEANLSSLPREDVWEKLIKPFLAEFERVLNSMKPSDLPGNFKFDGVPSGAFGLLYTEK